MNIKNSNVDSLTIVNKSWPLVISLVFSVMILSACGGSDSGTGASASDSDSDGIANTIDNCPNDANADQIDSDVNGQGDACDSLPTTYNFTNAGAENTVSYTGQTARQVLVSDLTDTISNLTRDVANTPADVVSDLEFFYSFDPTLRDSAYTALFELSGSDNLIGNDTDAPATTIVPGAISSSKNIKDKVAGMDSATHILGGEFFGWEGITTPALLMDAWLAALGEEAGDITDTIAVSGGATSNITIPTVTEAGLDIRQLVQKFLLGALTFSQGTADYFSIDFTSSANLTLASGKTYTEGAHDFDEAFGYYGAARNTNDLEDSVIANGYSFAESDSFVADNAIDLRSEFSFANSQNCAKRDLGSAANASPTNYTKEAFDAFLIAREILQNAATGATETTPGTISTEAAAALDLQIKIAAQTWEKCIAATVIHYINDVTSDMGDFNSNEFSDLDNFLALAQHWSEMKGFALGLQFSPFSPFRTGEIVVNGTVQAAAVDINDLKQVLNFMGNAPVLADGSQDNTMDNTENGSLYNGTSTAEAAKAAYIADLMAARTLLQTAYAFDSENVANW